MPNKKRSSEDIADKALARAKALKEVSEQNVRKQLMESFAPQLKKMISQQILEMEDDDLEMDDLEEGEGEGDDIDPEDLEDLENALEEDGGEGDDEDGDGHVEVPTDEVPVEDEPVEDEDLDEEVDDYEDLEEESDEDFLAELQSILEEDDMDDEEADDDMESLEESAKEDDEDEINEVEGKKNGDSYEQDAPPEGAHTEKYESADGGSYTEDGEGKKGDHTEKFENLVKENRKLRRALSEINNSLNETVLDEYKTSKFKSIVEGRKLTETAKLKVMRAIDEGKSEKEVDRISSVFESTLPKSSKKKRAIKESKGGRNSSIRKPRGKSKINENASGNSGNEFQWANRLAHLSGIE